MRSLRLFADRDGGLAPARGRIGGAEALPRPRPVEPLSALETDAWRRLRRMVAEARRRAAPAADLARVAWFPDPTLLDAWTRFAAAAEAWDTDLTGGAPALAEDIVSFARDVADRVVFMDGGYVVESGPPSEFFAAPKSERARQFIARYARG